MAELWGSLHDDLKTKGLVIWFGIPFIYYLMTKKWETKRLSGRGPSYTDKGQNDWMHRD